MSDATVSCRMVASGAAAVRFTARLASSAASTAGDDPRPNPTASTSAAQAVDRRAGDMRQLQRERMLENLHQW